MFSKTITNSSRFLMMPQSSQNLYFHLGMNADDDGFCEHFTIMRMTESKPDDLRILQAKGLVHVFDDRVLVIIDWKENNYLRSDRYTKSKYLEIYKEELKAIAECKTACLPDGIPVDDTGKVRLGKDSKGKDNTVSEESLFMFETFWTLYDKKIARKDCQKLWLKIKPDLYPLILAHVGEYVKVTPNKKHRKDPETYLKKQSWTDEIIQQYSSTPVKKSLSELAKENEELFA